MPTKTRRTAEEKAKRMIALEISIQILGRYYPDQSGRQNEALELLSPEELTNRGWKKAACNWLVANLKLN